MSRALRILAFCLVAALPQPASAGPVVAIFQAVGTWFAAQSAIVQIGIRLAVSVASSLLMQRLQTPPKRPGLQAQFTSTGGTEPQTTILGRFATHGHRVYHNSHANSRARYLRVFELGDLPGVEVERVYLGGEEADFFTTVPDEWGYYTAPNKRRKETDNAWFRAYDGTQTAPDALMLDKYGARQKFPWTTDHVLRGIPYAIIMCRGDAKVFQGVPDARFQVRGIPLYDPRKDSTAGGTGAHRWADPATWGWSDNPIVIVYNILRGITLADGRVWGGEAEEAEDLPFGDWAAAMNVCDEIVADGAGTRPRYTAGVEVKFTEAPADYIDELMSACNGQIAELGGVYYPQVGAPETPVVAISDDDVLVTAQQEFDPFPTYDRIFNGASVTHPAPDALWNARELEKVLFPALEAEDGSQRLFDLQLSAVYNPSQARQLAKELIEDNRRFRQHVIPLSPDYFHLRPLQSIDWTSAWNSYTDKTFEIAEVVYDLERMNVQLSVRERDPADFVFNPVFDTTDATAPEVESFEVLGVAGLAVEAALILDGSGATRRPAIKVSWDASDLALVAETVAIELRVPGAAGASFYGTFDVEVGEAILWDVLPGQSYEVRARIVSLTVDGSWSSPLTVTAPDVRYSLADIAAQSAAVPTGLALSSVAPGNGLANLIATWNAAANAVGYEIGATKSGGSEVIYPVNGLRWELATTAGTLHDVRVRSINALGAASAWSSTVQHTTAVDNVPPAVPTGVAAQAGVNMIVVSWTANGENDFSYYEVFEQATSTPAPTAGTAASFTAGTNTFFRSGLDYSTTRHYWIRAVDTSGNKSAWSARVSAATPAKPGVSTADLAGLVEATSFASSIKPVEVLEALPGTPHVEGRMVYLTSDNKLYRNTGSGWTAAVPSTDITGQLSDAQVAALAASKITGQLTNTQIADIAAAKLTGQITGTQITDNAITTAKINAGAITTAKLAASAVTANEIASNAITAAKIEAGAVTTAKLAAGAVTANEIASNAVIADKIAANAVTAAKIAANTITAGQIAAGAIGADQIAAKAITASKLLLTDTNNMWRKSRFTATDDSDGIFLSNVTLIADPTGSAPSSHVVSFPANVGSTGRVDNRPSAAVDQAYLPAAETGEAFYFSFMAYATAAQTSFYVQLIAYSAAGTSLGRTTVMVHSQMQMSNQWVRVTAKVTIAPAGAAFVLPRIAKSPSTAGIVYVSDIRLWRANAAELIVDGSIQANHLSAGEIITGTAQIKDAIITNAKIANLDAAKITTGTLNADRIAAGAISGDKIAATTITADRIVVGTIDMARLMDGAASDKISSINTTEQAVGNNTARLNVTTGPTTLSQFWQVGYNCEFRRRGVQNSFILETRVKIQVRTKTSGVWSAYADLDQSPLIASNTWTRFSGITGIMGDYEDVEFQFLIVVSVGNADAPDSLQNNFRNASIFGRSLMR